MTTKDPQIVILDFGSQYTQLIARRIRELGVYATIEPYNYPVEKLRGNERLKGIIFSGGPSSLRDPSAPRVDKNIFSLNVPILGICYGMELIAEYFGGRLISSVEGKREYGLTTIKITEDGQNTSVIYDGTPEVQEVWMSHADAVVEAPKNFFVTSVSQDSNVIASFESSFSPKIIALQFHPEVKHTVYGMRILENFLFRVAKVEKDWDVVDMLELVEREIMERAEGKRVVLAVSGGIDSTTLAYLLQKKLGKQQVHAIFVDTGLLRDREIEEVKGYFQLLGLEVDIVDARKRFLSALKGVENPEEKRKIVGKVFLEVFFERAGDFDLLAQGTLYPDVIETASVKGPSAKIKTHHNRVEEIEKLEKEGKILEPFRFLFKDEVRKIAYSLGIPEEIIFRHPFPGPGLAIRIIGEVTEEKLEVLRKADRIVVEEMKKAGMYESVWQAFAVLLPIKSVGVMGDERTYENVIAVRVVESKDGMTADWVRLPYDVLDRIARRIVREVKGVNRVVYDITSKPPATIEWE